MNGQAWAVALAFLADHSGPFVAGFLGGLCAELVRAFLKRRGSAGD